MIRGVIFDFDGTLTELTLNFDYLKTEIVNIARKYVTEEEIKAFEGYFIIEMIYEIEKKLGKGNTNFRHEAFERMRVLELEAAEGKDVYPYTRGVLQHLRGKGIKVGIITRSCLDVLKKVFPDMDTYVDGIVTREDIQYVKPDPSHVVETLRVLNILSEEALMVGDHPIDIMAGKALVMQTVGVLTGRTKKEDFQKAEATHILQDIRGIPDLLWAGKY
jgi:phosphoglycolate phosphatase